MLWLDETAIVVEEEMKSDNGVLMVVTYLLQPNRWN